MLDDELCTGCTACYTICPVEAIKMQEDAFGAKYPEIDKDKCVSCFLCKKACPILQTEQNDSFSVSGLRAYAVQAKEKKARFESSSGGLFSILAESVLEKKGAVVGCAMREDCTAAHHVIVENPADLHLLRGSKYVQSDLDDILKKIVDMVKEGRRILFSGTPCQVAGLHCLLGKKRYDNLITVDFICHGVPVPFAWRKYLQERENEYRAKAKRVSFRDKRNGWKYYTLVIDFENGMQYAGGVTEDHYLRGFVCNAYLRDSCYDCKIKGNAYCSDITIADFWGVEDNVPEYNDDMGTSLAIVHTEKALAVLDAVSHKIRSTEIKAENALANNSSYASSVPDNPLRKRVMREMKKMPFTSVIDRYYGVDLFSKIRRHLLKLLEK